MKAKRGKRGRKPKASVWGASPRSGVDLTFRTANEFRDRIAGIYVPRNNLKIYRYWCDEYRKAGGVYNGCRHTSRTATGIANKAAAQKFPGTAKKTKDRETRIGQIIKEIESAGEQLARWNEQAVEPFTRDYNIAVVRLRLAKGMMREGQAWPNRAGLWPDSVLADLGAAPALSDLEQAFLLDPTAPVAGSPQRLASSLAAALLQCNADLQAATARAIKAEARNTEFERALCDANRKGLLCGNYQAITKLKALIGA
ncbi:MAG TPA: hypothetical protein VJ738_01320 [Steroidobacteraceae bacterium]|nr:hypothetical protein [Steroidobacteraceae bacterium]